MRPNVIRDGKGLTELEFVLTMLIELHVVDWEKVEPFIKQFRKLDVNGDARLGKHDLELFQKHTKEEIKAMMNARVGTSALPAWTQYWPTHPDLRTLPRRLPEHNSSNEFVGNAATHT